MVEPPAKKVKIEESFELSEPQQQLIREDTANKKLWDEALDSLKEGPVGTLSLSLSPPTVSFPSLTSGCRCLVALISDQIQRDYGASILEVRKHSCSSSERGSLCASIKKKKGLNHAIGLVFPAVMHFLLSVCICFKEFPAQDGTDLHVRLLPGAGFPAHHHNLLAQRLQGASSANARPRTPPPHLPSQARRIAPDGC